MVSLRYSYIGVDLTIRTLLKIWYESTVTPSPQSDVKACTLLTRGPQVTVRVWGTILCRVMNVALRAELFPDILLGHVHAKALDQEPSAPVVRQVVGVESRTLALID